MIIVTGCNEGYLSRITPYLHSLQQYASFPISFVGVGFEPPAFDGISVVSMSREQNDGAPRETESIQHGSFLSVVKARANDVIMYTDGDFTMQRPMDDSECELLNLQHGQVATSWNGGPHETLATEAERLSQRRPYDWLRGQWGEEIYTWPIFNVGCVAMTKKTWQELYSFYMDHWEMAGLSFWHQARQQWLISYAVSKLFEVKILPWSLHAHGHFGMKPGMEYRPDGVYVDGKKALFRHYL